MVDWVGYGGENLGIPMSVRRIIIRSVSTERGVSGMIDTCRVPSRALWTPGQVREMGGGGVMDA
jgi:hypothetical protein